MRLKLDDDKYIMVEENSILSITAKGTKEDSKTSIYLEQGAITNEIQSKLNENSSYDVTTPNSVMAVRGTVFRVEIILDENNEVYTKVSTFEGKVGVKLIFPDGTVEENIVVVEGGKETIIHMDSEKTEYLSAPREIVCDEISIQGLEFLKTLMENGTDIAGISLEELETIITEKKEAGKEKEKTTEEETEEGTEKQTEKQIIERATETQVKVDTDICTVTFTYNGAVFGIQKIEKGKMATEPKLAPAQNGTWDFEFSQIITEDTTIMWK